MQQQDRENVLAWAVYLNGAESQMMKAAEEMAEAAAAIIRLVNFRRSDSLEHVQEELADVRIMLDQIMPLVGVAPVKSFEDAKLVRLHKRLLAETRRRVNENHQLRGCTTSAEEIAAEAEIALSMSPTEYNRRGM